MRKTIRSDGYTLMEAVIAVSLLALVSLVSVNVVVGLLRNAVKSQAGVDVEQAASFIQLSLESDINKSYSASVSGNASSKTLTLIQGTPAEPVTVVYTLTSTGCNSPLVCLFVTKGVQTTKLTDDIIQDPGTGRPVLTAVTIDFANSGFNLVSDLTGKPLAVGIVIVLKKHNPDPNVKMFEGQTTLKSTIVLGNTNL